MPTPGEIMQASAAFLNDQNRQIFTNANMLEYFNQALRDLQEQYELNDVPITHEVSATLAIPAGPVGSIVSIGPVPVPPYPAYPQNLITIKQMWESQSGQNAWTPMTPRDFLPIDGLNAQIAQFSVWAWVSEEIQLIAANQDNDIKFQYVKSMFTPIPSANITVEMGVKYNKMFSFLAYRTAALSAYYIGENETRALVLNTDAGTALNTALGIETKASQSIPTRRLPFRFSWKNYRGYR